MCVARRNIRWPGAFIFKECVASGILNPQLRRVLSEGIRRYERNGAGLGFKTIGFYSEPSNGERRPRLTAHTENRTYDRFPHKASLVCSPFNTDIYYHTQKSNHGCGGLCFESRTAFQRGTVLRIRMKDYSTDGLSPEAWEGFRSMAVAEVKWCREINGAGGNQYRVGVRYYDPAC